MTGGLAVLLLFLAMLVGLTLGTLGGGGAILTMPLLLYVAHLEQRSAIVGSLFLVGVTSAVSLVVHRKAARFGAGVPFALASMAGSYAGGRVSAHVPPAILLYGFCAVMIAASLAMMRKRSDGAAARPANPPLLALLGAGVGLLSGLIGAGGGFLIVPALSLVGGLPMREAIATSLFVLVLQTTTGLLGHVTHTSVPWRVALPVTAAAVVGSLVGARVGGKAAPETLKRTFAWLILTVALFMLAKSLLFT